jgi:hypothetical protein
MTKPLLAILLLLPLSVSAGERVGIKGVYLGMTAAQLEQDLGAELDWKPGEMLADFSAQQRKDRISYAPGIAEMTIAGQSCVLERVDVFNEGRLKLDKTLATVYSGYWNCAPPADKKKIRAALTHKFGTPDRVEDIGVLWSFGDARVYTLGKRHISVSLYTNSTYERVEALRRERELSDI